MSKAAHSISCLQRAILTVGSAFTAAYNPARADMVATLGELTGGRAARSMHHKMLGSAEGRRILREQPRLNSQTMDYDWFRTLPDRTFGREYVRFMDHHGFQPESRLEVQYVSDPELAYVLQRYRETHDFIHVLTGITSISVASETAVKWFEWMQTGLPMTLASSIVGPGISDPAERAHLRRVLIPWAIQNGSRSKFYMNIMYEDRWQTPVGDLQRVLNLIPAPPCPQ
ncbi:Ubiquinone biosynthesis protein [Dimargaris cristalligena]|uniref:4-hydroxy-3-methoxy-5-polyprenylbenzoate decarboxylase n=1 Tax=Dimargaris cristalligena TaxID=215637 RepID=A0A4Q0A1Y3_9FUNG|nr:Ubiquinone biosynthesis protein [Dimargaris cristalligena]RKP40103.1 ubiquinone biosynthesis protein Coq4 [Dimargaris cristalligena]|eukprot:RKP40103.1 ubiquinone biosynthesis protein Coq4 [Dimargaris cristalligena]